MTNRQDVISAIAAQRFEIEQDAQQQRSASEEITNSPYVVLSERENAIHFPAGLSGSLTKLTNGNDFINAGSGIQLSTGSNGSITISAPNIASTLDGNMGEVQYNSDGNYVGHDGDFAFDNSKLSLTVTSISSSLTKLSNGEDYLSAGAGIQLTTGSNGQITIQGVPTEDTARTWATYVPEIKNVSTYPMPPARHTITGRYFDMGGALKLSFDFTARHVVGADTGSGPYLISLPDGYEFDTSVISVNSPENVSGSISLGVGLHTSDVSGGGGTWAVVPVSTTQFALYGKSPNSSTSPALWSSTNRPLTQSGDLRVSFTATVPVITVAVTRVVSRAASINDAIGTSVTAQTIAELPVEVIDGQINAIAPDLSGGYGNSWGYYIGGTFTTLANGFEAGRGDFDVISTGTTSTRPFQNFYVNDTTYAIVPDGSGGAYIAGNFTSVRGVTRNRIARINSDGSLNDWYPTGGVTGGRIVGMHLDGDFLYIAGAFTTVAGTARARLARITVSTATLDTAWVPVVNAEPFAILTAGDYIYAGGSFSTATPAIGGVAVTTERICAWHKTTGALTEMTLTATASSAVWCLAADATHVYWGGTAVPTANTSHRLGRFSIGATTQDATWNIRWGSSTFSTAQGVTSIKLDGDFVFATGNWANTTNPLDGTSTNPRQYIAKFNKTRALETWYPVLNGGAQSVEVDSDNDKVYISGDFTSCNSLTRQGLVAVSRTTGTSNISWDGRISTAVLAGISKAIRYIGENLWVTSPDTTPTYSITRLARVLNTGRIDLSWQPAPSTTVNSLASDWTHLYVGMNAGTIGGLTNKNLVRFVHGISTVDTTWTTTTVAPVSGETRVAGNVLVVKLDDTNGHVYVGTNSYFVATTQGHIGRFSKTSSGNNASFDSSWNPVVSYVVTTNFVNSIDVYGDNVYFTGNFTSVNTTSNLRDSFAVVSRVNAVVDPRVRADFSTAPTTAIKFPIVADVDGAWVLTNGYQQHGSVVTLDKIPTLTTKDTKNSITTPYPKIKESWNVTGDVAVIIEDGMGGYFIGGSFTRIQGRAISRLAWIGSDGIVKSNWAPAPNDHVQTLYKDEDFLYVGGRFTNVGGISRARIARINLTGENATADTFWNPGLSPPTAGTKSVTKILCDSNYVYMAFWHYGSAAGFTATPQGTVAGISVNGFCRLSKTSPAVASQITSTGATGVSFNFNTDGTNVEYAGVRDMSIVENTLYLCGPFTSVNGISRNRAAAINLTTSNVLAWNPSLNGIGANIMHDDDWVYLSGHFYSANSVVPEGTATRGSFDIFSLDYKHSTMREHANLNFTGGRSSTVIPDGAGGAYVGGQFTSAGGSTRGQLARVNIDGTFNTGSLPALVDDGVNASEINALCRHENKLYVGGNFTKVISRVSELDRGGFDVIDPGNEYGVRPFPNFATNGVVQAIAPDFDGGVFIAGTFTSVLGQTRNRIAKINVDGTLNEFNPTYDDVSYGIGNGVVYALFLSGYTLYVGGTFTLVGGARRSRLASIDTSSGYVTSDWEALDINTGLPLAAGSGGANSNVYSICDSGTGYLLVGGAFTSIYNPWDTYLEYPGARNRLARLDPSGTSLEAPVGFGITATYGGDDTFIRKIATDGNYMYVCGRFSVGGRINIARIDVIDPLAFDSTWIATWGNNTTPVIDIQTGPNGYVYLCGSSTGNFTINGVSQSRNYLARLDCIDPANAFVDTTWAPTLNSYPLRVCPDDSGEEKVYIMGLFTSETSQSSVRYLSALDSVTGATLAWRERLETVPNSSIGLDMICYGGLLYVGCTSTTPTYIRNRIFRYDLTTQTIDDDWRPSLNGLCRTLATGGKTGGPTYLYAGGDFSTSTNATSTTAVTANRLCKWDLSTGVMTQLNIAATVTTTQNVWSLACDNTHVYVGCTIAYDNTATGFRRLGRYHHDSNIAGSGITGYDTSWMPAWGSATDSNLTGVGYVILDDENGWVYAGANFAGSTAPSGDGKVRNYIARFSKSSLSTTDWYPTLNGTVTGMYLDKPNNRMYIAGSFTSVNGMPRNNYAWVSTTGNGDTTSDVGQWGLSVTTLTGYHYDQMLVQNGKLWACNANASSTAETSYNLCRVHPTSGRIDYTFLMNNIGIPGVSTNWTDLTIWAYSPTVDEPYIYLSTDAPWGIGLISRIFKATAIQDSSWSPFGTNSRQYITENYFAPILIRENDILVGGGGSLNIRTDTSLVRVNIDGTYSSPLSLIISNANAKNFMFRRGKYLYVSSNGALNSVGTSGVVSNLGRINIVTGELTSVGGITTVSNTICHAIDNNKFLLGGASATGPFTTPVYTHTGTTNNRLLFVNFTDTPAAGDEYLTPDETDIS